ncbi:MAG TPA: hypothetical protein VH619_19965 [Verrucomicrobiae bacterium]|jgi:hypothetical protein|nr:hypothetical protein [Verrucomicrobiae bacterium]
MEAYKHSCPVCGQHVEYTAGYCGKQIQCPICGSAIVFPAILPKTGGKTISVEKKKPALQWAWNAKAIVHNMREFPHWKIVGQILVPFILIGALLAGAAFVKKNFGNEPAAPTAPVIQAEPGGWDKMTELARSDQKLQQCVQTITQAHNALLAAQRDEQIAGMESSRARGSQERELANAHTRRAELAINEATKSISFLRSRFQVELANYQKLGGTVDYQSKIPF